MDRTYRIAMRILKSYYVSTFVFHWGDSSVTAQLLKNECSDMKDGDRGIVLVKNGDIYSVKLLEPPHKHCFAIHDTIREEMVKQKVIPKCDYADIKKIVNVVKQGKVLYLGESYGRAEVENIVKSKEVAKMVEKFNSKSCIPILMRCEYQ